MDITRLGGFLLEAHPGLRRVFWRTSYQYLATRYPDWDWTFTDYGLAVSDDDPDRLQLFPMDEPDRLGIQLYHRVASARVRGLEVLEVSCGRGGGASYIARYLAPRRVVGLDVASGMIAFCHHRHRARAPGLVFCIGDAEVLPFGGETFDAVVNVESAHCYGSMPGFLAEASRVLRSDGWLLFADMLDRRAIGAMRARLGACGFATVEEEDMTSGVLTAMANDSDRRQAWISMNVPRALRGVFASFAGRRNTARYLTLRRGNTVYVRYAARKARMEVGDPAEATI